MIKSLIAIASMCLFAVWALRSTYAAMLMYWWYALFRPHDWMWWDISGLRAPLLATLLFFGSSILTGKWPSLDGTIHRLIAAFAICTLLAQMVSSCESYYALSYDFVLILALAALLTGKLLDSFKKIAILSFLVGVSFAIPKAGLGISTFLEGGSLYGAVVGSGGISGSNAVAVASGMTIFLLLPSIIYLWQADKFKILSFYNKPIIRFPMLILSVFYSLGLLFVVYVTDSRGAALALVLGGFTWIYLQRKAFKWLMLVGFISVVAWSTGMIPDAYVERIATVFVAQDDLDDSAISRPHFWGVAIDMAAQNPLGVGAGCYISNYSQYDPSGGLFGQARSVHSSYFNVLAEQGFAGFSIWLLMHISLFIVLFKIRRSVGTENLIRDNRELEPYRLLANGLIASHCVFLAGSVFYEISYNDITWLTFIMGAALHRCYISELSDNRIA